MDDDQLVPGDLVIHCGPGVYSPGHPLAQHEYGFTRRATKLIEMTDDHVVVEFLHSSERSILPREAFPSWELATPVQIDATRREVEGLRRQMRGLAPYDISDPPDSPDVRQKIERERRRL